MGDEVYFIDASKCLNDAHMRAFFAALHGNSFGLWHPPAYVHLLNAMSRIFGMSALTPRLVSISTFFVSLLIIYLLSLQFFKGAKNARAIAFLASLLYSVNPFSVRGSLLVDIDGTILNASFLILMYFLALWPKESVPLSRQMLYGLLCALVLWTKFSSPFIFFASMLIFLLFTRDFKKMLAFTVMFAIGCVIFLLTWYIYCLVYKSDFLVIFRHSGGAIAAFLQGIGTHEGRLSLARNIWAPVMWISPSFALLIALSLRKIFKERAEARPLMSIAQFAFYGLCVAVGYIFVGGVTHSFPRYHYAMMPVFVITVAYLLVSEITFDKALIKNMGVAICILVLYHVFFVGDPLYTVNYAWKEDIILRGGRAVHQILTKELRQITLILLTIPLAYIFFRLRKFSKPFLLALFSTALAFNLALSLVQMKTNYNTLYCYGAKGVEEAAKFIQENTDIKAPIFSPTEFRILANETLDSYTVSYVHGQKFKVPGQFIQVLKENDVQCVVYGIASYTVDQYERIFNNANVQQFLESRYIPHDIGSYKIWILKNK